MARQARKFSFMVLLAISEVAVSSRDDCKAVGRESKMAGAELQGTDVVKYGEDRVLKEL